jgi:hypothetical protein
MRRREGTIGSSLPRLQLTYRYTIAAVCTMLHDFISRSAVTIYEGICAQEELHPGQQKYVTRRATGDDRTQSAGRDAYAACPREYPRIRISIKHDRISIRVFEMYMMAVVFEVAKNSPTG